MEHAQKFEFAIEAAASMKDLLATLTVDYNRLPGALKAEHAAISSGDIREMETACARKSEIADAIAANFTKVIEISTDVIQRYADHAPEDEAPSGRSVIATLARLCQSDASDSLALQVLAHQVTGLDAAFDKFEQTAQETKPLIEQNQYLVANMLRNYRESYIFFQEISEEAGASYNDQGRKPNSGRVSGFKASA